MLPSPRRSRSLPLLATALTVACGDPQSTTDDASNGSSSSGADSATTLDSSATGSMTAATATASATDPTTATEATTASTTAGSDDSSDSGDDSSGTTGTASPCGDAVEIPYEVAFATYLGGAADWEHARDAAILPDGSIVVVGGTASNDFPVTPGAADGSFGGGGNSTGPHGDSDVFVAKFTSDGTLEWATYLGGPNYDRAYAVEVDGNGDVLVSGRAGPGFPVTGGVFQTEYLGNDSGFYGLQNGFIAKLAGDGGSVTWASYFSVGHLIRDFAIDGDGDIYAAMTYQPGAQGTAPWLAAAVAGAYQPVRHDDSESGIAKISGDGTAVLWATWLGGTGVESGIASVRVDASERPYLATYTDSTDLPTTGIGVTASNAGGVDLYVARLSADGSALEMGAYIGGSGDEYFETHAIGLGAGDLFIGGGTDSQDLPTTPGAFQPQFGGGAADAFVARLTTEGTLVAATYYGGSGNEGPDGISVTAAGELLFTGETTSTDLPSTAGAHQPNLGGGHDAYAIRFGADLDAARYASYFGGGAYDNGRGATLADDCTAVIVGAADGAGFPTTNAWQPSFAGGPDQWGNGDAFVVVLR